MQNNITAESLQILFDQIYQEILLPAFENNSSGDEYIYYVHNDHLGAPVKMTNELGLVIWQAVYDPFGKAVVDEDVDLDGISVEMNVRFPGQYYDSESGLHYNYFRTYDPNIGRYITSDPIGLLAGTNTYTYVDNNPLNFIDPLGLSKTDKLFGIPKQFWRWYHRNEKRPGDPDLDKNSADNLFKEWKDRGKPGPDSKNKRERGSADPGLMEWLIPWPILPSELGCGTLDCNPLPEPDPKPSNCP